MDLPTPMNTHRKEMHPHLLPPVPHLLLSAPFVSEPILKDKVTGALQWPLDNALDMTGYT